MIGIYTYLGKEIDKLIFNDGMFNEWRILHLYLCKKMY